jgi:AcrR family transcriptional regulator
MKDATATRNYRQHRRAAAAEANTERILAAALELFSERPFDQITLAEIADRAGVGLQTVIRRAGTKDGLARLVNAWVQPQVSESRGEPPVSDPAAVAAALERHYERWGDITDRMLRQEDVSPALTEAAQGGRDAHRAWIETAFAAELAACPPAARDSLRARLVGVCGAELWLVLRRNEGLSAAAARDAVAQLVCASLASVPSRQEP